MDVTDFVLARLVDLERNAQREHEAQCESMFFIPLEPLSECERVLHASIPAQCAAMRKVVERQRRYQRDAVEHRGDLALAGATLGLLGAVVDLAVIWSDHTDFDPKWRGE